MDLNYQFELMRAIRNFFDEKKFMEVATPPLVENPGMETHIHSFQAYSQSKKQNLPLYLHTSPEFAMKKLLASGFEKIFSLGYVFRDEPDSPIHRNQFLMLEWYRKNERYEKIMQDCEELITYCHQYFVKKNFPVKNHEFLFTKKTVQELFLEILNVDILNYLEIPSIKKLLAEKFPEVPVPKSELAWDDYFFLLFLNKIEPHFEKFPFLIVSEYPAPLSALSTLKKSDPRVCERFEIYASGIELCNAFNELTDLRELKKRFDLQNTEKKKLYGYSLPEPKSFYRTMENYPASAGIALGVERLLLALSPVKNPFF